MLCRSITAGVTMTSLGVAIFSYPVSGTNLHAHRAWVVRRRSGGPSFCRRRFGPFSHRGSLFRTVWAVFCIFAMKTQLRTNNICIDKRNEESYPILQCRRRVTLHKLPSETTSGQIYASQASAIINPPKPRRNNKKNVERCNLFPNPTPVRCARTHTNIIPAWRAKKTKTGKRGGHETETLRKKIQRFPFLRLRRRAQSTTRYYSIRIKSPFEPSNFRFPATSAAQYDIINVRGPHNPRTGAEPLSNSLTPPPLFGRELF